MGATLGVTIKDPLDNLRHVLERAEIAGIQCEALEDVKAKLAEFEQETEKDLTIAVCHAATGKVAALIPARNEDTVLRLREAVLLQARGDEGFGESDLHFVYNTRVLNEGVTLQEAGLGDNAIVFVVQTPLRCSASLDGTARLWYPQSGGCCMVLAQLGADTASAAFSPSGLSLLTVSRDGEAIVWCVKRGIPLCELLCEDEEVVLSGEFSSDGLQLVGSLDDDTAGLWCASTGKRLQTLRGHEDLVRAAIFSPDSSLVATASRDRCAALWCASSGRREALLQGHTGSVIGITFSLMGDLVATASTDQTARVWCVKSGACLHELTGHQAALQCVAFSPTSDQLLTAAFDGQVRIWQTDGGECTETLQAGGSAVSSCHFSPDGASVLIAGGSECIRLFSAATGECALTLLGHTDHVRTASFSSDGMLIISGSFDGTARVWSAVTGMCLQILSSEKEGLVSSSVVAGYHHKPCRPPRARAQGEGRAEEPALRPMAEPLELAAGGDDTVEDRLRRLGWG